MPTTGTAIRDPNAGGGGTSDPPSTTSPTGLYEATFVWSLAMNSAYDTDADTNGAIDIGYAKIRFESPTNSGFTVVRGDYAGTYGGQPHYYFSLERDGATFNEPITDSYVYTSEDSRLNIQDNWAVGDNIGLSGAYSAFSFVSITEIGTGDYASPAGIAPSGGTNISNKTTIVLTEKDQAIATGDVDYGWGVGFSGIVTGFYLRVLTAPIGSALELDIKKNGTSILSTNITIDDGELNTSTATTPAVISSALFVAGDELTFDFIAVGSSVAGTDAQLTIFYDEV